MALGLCISWAVEQNYVKNRLIVITMIIFAAASIIGLKNLSPIQTQAIGYANIPSDLQLAIGLCISWFVEINCEKQTATNYYGEIGFLL